jgi:hypothetical protein
MAGKLKMPEDELDDPSLLVPETPDQTHRTFINPEHRLRRLESMINEYEDTQKAILQKLNLLTANIDVPPHIAQKSLSQLPNKFQKFRNHLHHRTHDPHTSASPRKTEGSNPGVLQRRSEKNHEPS